MINVKGLRKVYGKTVAVDDLSLQVLRGEIFGIVGPNGAGKTTTVESLMGLRLPDEGIVRVFGLDPRRQGRQLRGRMGVQLQQAALPNRIKVWEALDLFASFYKDPADWRDLMDHWGLTDHRNTAFAKLSGGQKQRLFIALALLNRPEVVLFDEITTGLDPQARHATWELIRAVRQAGTTVVLVTHFMEEAQQLCDRVAIIDQGRLLALDTPEALIRGLEAQTQVRFTGPRDADLGWLGSIPGVARVERDGDSVVVFGDGPLLARVATALTDHGLEPEDLRTQKVTLEDVFLARTGRQIRV